MPPEEMFKHGEEAAKYSKYDDKGIPTHLANGEEISKKQRKKLEKLYETQQKNYKQVFNSCTVFYYRCHNYENYSL